MFAGLAEVSCGEDPVTYSTSAPAGASMRTIWPAANGPKVVAPALTSACST